MDETSDPKAAHAAAAQQAQGRQDDMSANAASRARYAQQGRECLSGVVRTSDAEQTEALGLIGEMQAKVEASEAKLLGVTAALDTTKEQLATVTKALEEATARASKAEAQGERMQSILIDFQTTVRVQAQVLPLR